MSELIDIFDEYGIPTGKIKTREDVHRDGDWHKVVQLFILNNNKILLQQRSHTKKSDPLKWCASASGHISAGETGETTVKKESLEELGIELDQSCLKYISTFKSPSVRFNNGKQIINNHFVELYVSTQHIDLSKLILQQDELESVDFFEIEVFRNMVLCKDEALTDTPILFQELLHYIDLLE